MADNRLAVPPLYTEHAHMQVSDNRFLLRHAAGLAEVLESRTEAVHSGIGVFGAGATNWYHWLIEILPAAFLAESLPKQYLGFPLLVPEHVRSITTFGDALQLFAGDRSVVLLSNETLTRVDNLVFIDPPVRGPMNMQAGYWPSPKDYSQHDVVLRAFRKAMIDRLGLAETKPTRRLFLARSNALRSYNQDDLIAIAADRGFEVVFPETMTFREQVETYLQSEFLIGPSGAAFANTLFCQPGTRALTWILPQYSGFCAYSNLARVVGIDLRYLFVSPTSTIGSTHDAYKASYNLDAGAFGARVDLMLGH
ncbi:glycosyltransferase family 61 protein [Allitabrizicola rongguiensis]|uniref:glycosyltransferase family 61 protein n=1 Tax=Alitabrizicola rongguiensis TaxID=2909234 RepID=UPI001F1CCF53|nr:glycosyltransferase family 61 protein [Tabrizicola rongguiensis]